MKTYPGIVQEGSRRARELGYPTVNIPLEDKEISGIYAARVHWGDQTLHAVAFADPTRGILEAHILDFSREMLGESVEIEVLKKMRESKPFESDDALKAMIAQDVAAVREYLHL